MRCLIKFYSFLLLIISFSCVQKPENGHNDIMQKIYFDSVAENVLSEQDLLSSLKLIKLETNDNCLVGWIRQVAIVEKCIFIRDNKEQLFVFGESGNFLNRIGTIGQGPGEYLGITCFYIDKEKHHVGIVDAGTSFVTRYSFDGKYIDKFKYDSKKIKMFSDINYIGDGKLLITLGNSPDNIYNYMIVNEENFSVESIQLPYIVVGENLQNYGEAFVCNAGNDIYVPTLLTDTVYHLNNGKFVPYFIFENGLLHSTSKEINKYGPYFIASEAEVKLKENGYSQGIYRLFSSDNILYFIYVKGNNSYGIFWDIKNNKGFVTNSDTRKNILSTINSQLMGTSADALIRFITAEDIVKSKELFINSNIYKIMDSVNEEDNPVIALYYYDKLMK